MLFLLLPFLLLGCESPEDVRNQAVVTCAGYGHRAGRSEMAACREREVNRAVDWRDRMYQAIMRANTQAVSRPVTCISNSGITTCQ